VLSAVCLSAVDIQIRKSATQIQRRRLARYKRPYSFVCRRRHPRCSSVLHPRTMCGHIKLRPMRGGHMPPMQFCCEIKFELLHLERPLLFQHTQQLNLRLQLLCATSAPPPDPVTRHLLENSWIRRPRVDSS